MAYIDQSAVFTYGSNLTSTQMQNLRDNLNAAFAQDSGAPTLTNAYIESSMIGSMTIGPDHVNSYSLLEKNIATLTINNRVLGNTCVMSRNLYAAEIGSGHIHIDAIGSGHIGQNEVGSCHISSLSIAPEKLAWACVESGKIDTNAVQEDNINANAVTGTQLAAGAVENGHMADSAIKQAELDTTLGVETMVDAVSMAWTTFELDGGTYGFYPQIKFESSTTSVQANVLNMVGGNTAYTSTLAVLHGSGADREVYVQQRYIDACSEVYFIFVMRYKKDHKITRIAFKPNHPAFMSGINPEKKPHPWVNIYDPKIHEVLIIFPSKKLLKEMAELQNYTWGTPSYDITQVLREYYEIDTDCEIKWPTKKVTMYVDPVTKEDIKLKIPRPNYLIPARLVKKNSK